MRILVIEDEEALADTIATKLRAEKYEVDTCFDGESGLDCALDNIYDLIILDIMLPKLSGLEVLKEIKSHDISAKIIMLTARSTLDDKLKGFDAGANDYVTKPFHLEELIARVNANLRTTGHQNKDLLTFGDLTLNIRTSVLICEATGESINLPYREFLLLEYLMHHQGQIVSKMQLYDNIWGFDNDFESNNLEAYLSFLRKKSKLLAQKSKSRPFAIWVTKSRSQNREKLAPSPQSRPSNPQNRPFFHQNRPIFRS